MLGRSGKWASGTLRGRAMGLGSENRTELFGLHRRPLRLSQPPPPRYVDSPKPPATHRTRPRDTHRNPDHHDRNAVDRDR